MQVSSTLQSNDQFTGHCKSILDTLYAVYLVRRVLFIPPPVPAHRPPALGNSRTGLGTESWNMKRSYEAGTGIASPLNILFDLC